MNISLVGGGGLCKELLGKTTFDYMQEGEDLVEEPFRRLIAERQLYAHKHRGFWMPMDTFKDKQAFEDRYESGDTPWCLWDEERSN